MKWVKDNRHLAMAGFWVAITAPAAIFWPESVLWVIVVSHYANFASEVASHHAKKAEKNNG